MNITNTPPHTTNDHIALLHPRRTPKGYRFDASFDGELVVRNSRNTAYQLARVLEARGLTGIVWLVDAATGQFRLRINIKGAAKLSVIDDDVRGLHVVKYRAFPETVGHPESKEGRERKLVPDNDDSVLLLDRTHAA